MIMRGLLPPHKEDSLLNLDFYVCSFLLSLPLYTPLFSLLSPSPPSLSLLTSLSAYLRYLRRHGYHWDAETSAGAALGGMLDVLQFLFDNGCAWDEQTCMNAAFAGHLQCLQYLLPLLPFNNHICFSLYICLNYIYIYFLIFCF